LVLYLSKIEYVNRITAIMLTYLILLPNGYFAVANRDVKSNVQTSNPNLFGRCEKVNLKIK
jgi:heme A synthase